MSKWMRGLSWTGQSYLPCKVTAQFCAVFHYAHTMYALKLQISGYILLEINIE